MTGKSVKLLIFCLQKLFEWIFSLGSHNTTIYNITNKSSPRMPRWQPFGHRKEPLAFPLNQIHIFWDSVANFICTVHGINVDCCFIVFERIFVVFKAYSLYNLSTKQFINFYNTVWTLNGWNLLFKSVAIWTLSIKVFEIESSLYVKMLTIEPRLICYNFHYLEITYNFCWDYFSLLVL